jgi:hypothetical protein
LGSFTVDEFVAFAKAEINKNIPTFGKNWKVNNKFDEILSCK